MPTIPDLGVAARLEIPAQRCRQGCRLSALWPCTARLDQPIACPKGSEGLGVYRESLLAVMLPLG